MRAGSSARHLLWTAVRGGAATRSGCGVMGMAVTGSHSPGTGLVGSWSAAGALSPRRAPAHSPSTSATSSIQQAMIVRGSILADSKSGGTCVFLIKYISLIGFDGCGCARGTATNAPAPGTATKLLPAGWNN